jgi:phosphatidylglycerol lysyltransferase
MTDLHSTTPDNNSSILDTHRRGSLARRLLASFRYLWPVWFIALATLANGVLGIVSVLMVRFGDKPALFTMPLPFGLYHWSRSLTLLFGFALLYLSFHLFQGRRTAWGLALGGTIMAAIAHVGRGQLWYEALASVAIIVLLLLFRRRFTVRSEPRSIAQGVGLMLLSLLLALAYGTLGFWLMDKKDFGLEFNLADALLRTLREFSLVGNTDLVTHTRHARWFLDSLDLLGLVAGGFALYSLFRPVAYRLRTLPQQRALMKSILEEYGGTSLDYFKLWSDKSYFFSADQRCGIAYKAVGGVALSLGDPVGAPQGLEETTRAFVRFCADNGWDAAFHQAQAGLLPMYHHLGLQSLKIGEEAVVNLDHFTTDTLKHGKHLRQSLTRFEKEGYQFVRFLPPLEAALMNEVKQVSDEWLRIPGRHERSFSLGYFTQDYLNEFPLAVIRGSTGRIVAFTNEVRSYRTGEATIDLMRHRPDAPNGTMDFLFISLMLALKELGFRTFNLGMAPYVGVGDAPDASLEERVVHELAEHATRFFSYKGIRDYKGKFKPEWEDRFLVYQGGPLGLVRTAVALVRITD